MDSIKRKPLYIIFLVLLYLGFFLCLFAWYPLHNTLPGLSDTIYNITIFNDYWNRIGALLSGETIGNALYPEEMMQLYSEPYFGQAFIFLLCKFIIRNDIFSYALFLSSLYALTALGAFIFFRLFFKNRLLAATLGLCFASSSFMISQMELLNGLAYFPFFISLAWFLKYRNQQKPKLLFGSAVVAALQVYFSPYIALYLIIIILMLTFVDFVRLRLKMNIGVYLLGAFIGVIMISPYLYLVFIKSLSQATYNLTFDMVGNFSFQLADFFRSLPHNLFYDEEGFFQSSYTSGVIRNTNSGFIGFVAYVTAFLGLFQKKQLAKRIGILLIILGLVLSVGPYLVVGDNTIPMPLYLLYKHTIVLDFLRVPARAFSLFIMGILLFSGVFLSSLSLKRAKWIVILFGVLFVFENIPLHDDYHAFLSKQLSASKQHIVYLENQPGVKNIAHLPSSLYSGKNYSKHMLSEFNREYIYAYWQTKYKHNTINGPCNFCPESRMENNTLLMHAGEPAKLKRLITGNKLDFVLYHPEFALDDQEKELLDKLLKSEQLEPVVQNDSLVIFKTL